MNLPLVVVPDAAAGPGEHRSDGEQKPHLPGLEDASLDVDERDAFASERKARPELVGSEMIVRFGQPADVIERCLSDRCIKSGLAHTPAW